MEIITSHIKLLIPYLVVDKNMAKLKTTLISLESCSCDFIEIHGKSSKCIYVDVTTTLAKIWIP